MVRVVCVLLVCVCVVCGVRPPALVVLKCCPDGHQLTTTVLAGTELSANSTPELCTLTHRDRPWTPRVYAPARHLFIDRLPVHWRVTEGLPHCERLRVLPEHAAPYALLANNGSLMVRGAALVLPPTRYCADAAAALVCADDVSWTPTPTKCCAAAYVFDGTRCVPGEKQASAVLAELIALVNLSSVVSGWPTCADGSRYAVAGALHGASVSDDGALQLSGGGVVSPGAWCGEGVVGEEGARALACESAARSVRVGVHPARHTLYGAGLAVGAMFLCATLAAGFALPAAHHALHWRCQTHYVAALMLGDVLLAVTQLAADAIPPTLCRALAVCMHFLFLSAFFWLNTMCFNIWWTFRDFRPTSLERGQEAWRLRVYMVYAWGGPLVVAGAGALLDALPEEQAVTLLRPRFAVQRCWFYGDMEILVYFFGPVGVLLLVNLALFASTTRQLTCGLWRRDDVKSTAERAALGRVCAKLVVVMGVTWSADVISWAVGGPPYVWYVTDLLNALQGVFIFLVVGCQRHAWHALKRAAHACCARSPLAHASANTAAHSSTHLPDCGESLTQTTPALPALPTLPAPRVPMETVC